jgi:hypothetical protein
LITGADFHRFSDHLLSDEESKKALLTDGVGWLAGCGDHEHHAALVT